MAPVLNFILKNVDPFAHLLGGCNLQRKNFEDLLRGNFGNGLERFCARTLSTEFFAIWNIYLNSTIIFFVK